MLRAVALVLIASSASLAGPPRVAFIKEFPGSSPAYVNVSVARDGTLLYQEAKDDTNPLHATMEEADVAPLFNLADQLNHFRGPLESGLKVANTGAKVFRFEPESGEPSEARFNYSTIPAAQQLLERFEQIANSERAYIELDRTVHFDQIGVNDALAQIESLWLRKQLAAPKQFLPLLNRISHRQTFMHLVRERAARLSEQFQAGALTAGESVQKNR